MKKMREFWLKNIHQSWFVVWLCVGIVGGIVLGLVFRINFFASPVFFIVSGILFIICLIRPLLLCSVLALIAGFLLSFVRVAEELTDENYIRQFHGAKVVIVGEIDGDPETDEKGTNLKLINLRFGEDCEMETGGDECYETKGSLYVSLSKNEELARGDKVRLSGKLAEGFSTYVGYMYRPRVMWWARPEPGNFAVVVRNWFAERISGLIKEPEVKLGLSYLLGMKTGLPDDLEENLRVVGLTHIVVASGAHLAILVEVARKIFGKISRFAGLMFSAVFILFFMAMVGWTPSIMRAGVMAILTLVGWYVGRKINPLRMILIVAAGTLLFNPNFMINLGWLLSFASYAGIMVVMPRLQKFFYGKKKPSFVGSTVLMTVSATLMTLPIILYFYGQVSLIAVVANLLILPTLSVAMGLVFFTGVVAGVPFFGTVVAWCATRILEFHIGVVEFFGQMQQFLVKIEPYQPWVFLIYMVIVMWFSNEFFIKIVKRRLCLAVDREPKK